MGIVVEKLLHRFLVGIFGKGLLLFKLIYSLKGREFRLIQVLGLHSVSDKELIRSLRDDDGLNSNINLVPIKNYFNHTIYFIKTKLSEIIISSA